MDSPVQAMSFVDKVSHLLSRTEYRRAITHEDREAIFRLRYDCYIREGSIDPNPERRFTDPYDDIANVTICGLFVDGALSASMRFHVATPEHPEMPAQWAFPEYTQPLVDAGLVIVDPTRFVVAQEVARQHPGLAYLTARVGWVAGQHHGADRILSCARSEHQAFYKRVFGYKVVCEARHYPTLNKPQCMMVLDFPARKDWVHRRYPFFMSTEAERRAIFCPDEKIAARVAEPPSSPAAEPPSHDEPLRQASGSRAPRDSGLLGRSLRPRSVSAPR